LLFESRYGPERVTGSLLCAPLRASDFKQRAADDKVYGETRADCSKYE
jgi:hypothetical protein